MARPGVALQMYTVREDAERDFAGTLRKVAELGYPAVQPAGYGGLSAAALAELLGDLGLAVAGNHVNLSRLEHNLDEEIEFNRTIGNRDLVCPALPEALRGDADGYRQAAESFNRIGERCKAAGARFSYHNHAFEFELFGDTTGLDLLLGGTDPSLVFFEPDVYWIEKGGASAEALIRRYAGRCPIIHLKDMTGDAEATYAEVGEGSLDFAPIFEASEAGGAEWYVVEQDRCRRPALESARLSLDNLRRWGKL